MKKLIIQEPLEQRPQAHAERRARAGVGHVPAERAAGSQSWSVSDDGCGHRGGGGPARLRAFLQGRGRARRAPALGLASPWHRRLVEAHDGAIRAESSKAGCLLHSGPSAFPRFQDGVCAPLTRGRAQSSQRQWHRQMQATAITVEPAVPLQPRVEMPTTEEEAKNTPERTARSLNQCGEAAHTDVDRWRETDSMRQP